MTWLNISCRRWRVWTSLNKATVSTMENVLTDCKNKMDVTGSTFTMMVNLANLAKNWNFNDEYGFVNLLNSSNSEAYSGSDSRSEPPSPRRSRSRSPAKPVASEPLVVSATPHEEKKLTVQTDLVKSKKGGKKGKGKGK